MCVCVCMCVCVSVCVCVEPHAQWYPSNHQACRNHVDRDRKEVCFVNEVPRTFSAHVRLSCDNSHTSF